MKKKLTLIIIILFFILSTVYIYSVVKRKNILEDYLSNKVWFDLKDTYDCLLYNQAEIESLIKDNSIEEGKLHRVSKCFHDLTYLYSNIQDFAYKVENFNPQDTFDGGLPSVTQELSAYINKKYLDLPVRTFNELKFDEIVQGQKQIKVTEKELEKFKKISLLIDDMIHIYKANDVDLLGSKENVELIKSGKIEHFFKDYQQFTQELGSGYLMNFLYD